MRQLCERGIESGSVSRKKVQRYFKEIPEESESSEESEHDAAEEESNLQEGEFVVQRIVNHYIINQTHHFYILEWSDGSYTMEPAENLDCPALLLDFFS